MAQPGARWLKVDSGIRNQLTGMRNTGYGHILENLVYLELIRRGFDVSIGKIGSLETDFVAESGLVSVFIGFGNPDSLTTGVKN